MCLDPNLKYSVEKLWGKTTFTNVPVEMEKRAFLLRQYCKEILTGNYSNWIQITECISKRANEFLDIFWGIG